MKRGCLICFSLLLMLLQQSCSKAEEEIIPEEPHVHPNISSAVLKVECNQLNLISDVIGVVEDTMIVFNVPNITANNEFVGHFTFEGEYLSVEDHKFEKDSPIELIFDKPLDILTVGDHGEEKNYHLQLNYFTGLPVCWIETENKSPILSKEEYVNGKFSIIYNGRTRCYTDIKDAIVQVKGRGNSTWTEYPKKPYRLKFETKQTLFGEASDKSWVLLANYYDKTMLANHIAFTMGRDSKLDYTPCDHFCELILNGVYQGTYQISEKIKIDKNRVNVGKDGYLLEIDGYARQEADAKYFSTKNLTQVINIKDPDVEYGDESYTWVKEYINEADSVLYSENFLDPEKGWRKYYDFDSCVDYYLINEIVKNTDFVWWNAWMHLSRGGKICMGPLWDYDNAFGLYVRGGSENPEGFWCKNQPWFVRMFDDPQFVAAVKERFRYFYSRKEVYLTEINKYANYLEPSVIENDRKWNILYNAVFGNNEILGAYYNEVTTIKRWLATRFEWLNSAYNEI